MPLSVSCSCGKPLAIPDAYAGKRVKCPQCGSVLTVPASSGSPSGTSGGGSPRPAAVAVRCRCGKTLSIRADLAGKAVKCPACGQAVQVPTPGKPAVSAAPDPMAESTTIAASRSIADLLDEFDLTESKTGFRCPECRADLQPDAVLCIRCGYRLDKGKKMVTKRSGNSGKGKK